MDNGSDKLRNTNSLVSPLSQCRAGGTPIYSSIESWRYNHRIDNTTILFKKNDVWSFGITAFEIYADLDIEDIPTKITAQGGYELQFPNKSYEDEVHRLIDSHIKNDTMSRIIKLCLKVNVEKRPSLKQLRGLIGSLSISATDSSQSISSQSMTSSRKRSKPSTFSKTASMSDESYKRQRK